jgi:ubiquinone/menaquinone biosynthesis C-methylase UbiE
MAISKSNLYRNLFQEEYTPEFVDRWDDLIDWKKRHQSENGFFERLLKEHETETVLDAACGTGFHTVTLAHAGFDVTASDGAATMLDKALENANRFGLKDIDFVEANWCHLTEAFPGKKFDAVVILGNAYTHLFDEKDRIQALKEVYNVLNDGGIAVIDHRNYDKILDKGFDSKHQFYYVGDVNVEPEEVNEDFVRLRYSYPDGSSYHLTLSSIRQDYVDGLLRKAGFSDITSYGDFETDFDTYDPDFIVQVAVK